MNYKKGQRVKVEYGYEGEITYVGTNVLHLKTEGGNIRTCRLGRDGLKVTALDPANWPPQVGDIWEAEGVEWFARIPSRPEGPCFLLSEERKPALYPGELKALNPVLVRRRGQ